MKALKIRLIFLFPFSWNKREISVIQSHKFNTREVNKKQNDVLSNAIFESKFEAFSAFKSKYVLFFQTMRKFLMDVP